MASTTDLDRLKKSEQGIQATNNSTSEPFQRDRIVRADEVKTGLTKLNGSWASEYLVEDATATSSEAKIRTSLGQVGLGDIDFIPYGENTSRMGEKGAPTLGAPISFEVLGPTLKSPHVDWTWFIDSFVNTLTIQHSTKTIATEYGITNLTSESPEVISLEELNADHGGLYLIVSHLGNTYENWDSSFNPVGLVSPSVLPPDRIELEVFKVKEISSTTITIDDNTRLGKIFSSPSGKVAGITFLRKKTSRLLEAPKSEGTAFFILPPEKSSSLDFEPPLSNWKAGDFHTLTYAGVASSYGSTINTPVPAPMAHGEAVNLKGSLVQAGSPVAGEFHIETEEIDALNRLRDQNLATLQSGGNLYATVVGKLLRVVKVDDSNAPTSLTDTERNAYYGYFEILEIDGVGSSPRNIKLKRVSEQNHVSGNVVWNPTFTNDVKVEFTIHRSISELLSSKVAQTVEIESARIKGLISPNSTSIGEGASINQSSLQRGSVCTWDGNSTTSGNSPSNLSELGFEVIVYPAKVSSDSTSLVADYDNPLSPELYDVDYEGATVYFKSAYTQNAAVTNHSTNPLKRTALFISCVPLAQEASYGIRLTTLEDGMEKGAFQLPKIPQILTHTSSTPATHLLDLSEADHSTFWDGTNSVFIPSLTLNDIPQTGVIEAEVDSFNIGEKVTLRFFYRGASNHNNGVKLDKLIIDFDGTAYGTKIDPNTVFNFSRHGKLSYKQSVLAGRSARSEGISFTDGSISYNADGSMSLSVSGLRTDESTLLYDSNSRKWVVDSDKYEIGLSITRGDLVASNVTEIPTETFSVKPVVALSSENDLSDRTNDSDSLVFNTNQFESLPDMTGLYLNVEGGAIRSAQVPTFANNQRVVLGLDHAGTTANPWQSKFVSYKNGTGSALSNTDSSFQDALNTALVTQYPNDYESGTSYFAKTNTTSLMLAGRSPSVFPAYSYVESISIEDITANVTNVSGFIPSFRYLLSLEEVGGNKWVTVAIKVPEIQLPSSTLSGEAIGEHIAQAQFVCDALNEDLYFGHSARLLNRAGFYEGFHQDYSLSIDVGPPTVTTITNTINTGLQAKIDAYTNHTVRGERQVLWVTTADPRHPNYNTANTSEVTIALICTGRGCGKIPIVEGAVSDFSIQAEAIKSENQLINVIASIGSAEQLQSDKVFNGMFGSNYHRIGLYWESSTLPDGSASETRSVDAMAEANHTVLAFDRNGFLPIGPLVGSSRLIYDQAITSTVSFYLESSMYAGNERRAGSPLRNKLSVDEYVGAGKYFDLLPFDISSAQKNVGESFDFLTQGHWLDNPSFSFNSDDDLSEEDLGLYTWVSRDYVYPVDLSNSASSYLGLVCTFSANKRERSSFSRPLMSPNHKGYEDMVVSITSEYFARSLYSPSVIEVGDDFHIFSRPSKTESPNTWQNRQSAKAKVLGKSESTDGVYQYKAILTSINGQYGGFSESLYWQPLFAHSTGTTLFDADYNEVGGSNLFKVSLVGGNNFFWTQGNLRSLLTAASVTDLSSTTNFLENRDTGAVDGGFGRLGSSLGTNSASLISGGRIGLLNGLPQNYAGISFASISGGLGTSIYRGGQDYENLDEPRTFETFLDHGVFSYVSLPTGTGGSSSSTIGQLSREMDKRSDYKSATFGGSSGLRVSGDVQLFIRNLRVLGSDDNTAFVMHTDYAPPTNTDYLISNADVTLDVTSPFLPYNETGTGPTTSALQAQKSASGFNTYDLKSQGGAHTPSGVGLFGPPNPLSSSVITDASVRRTATISLGLTLADLKGISNSLGKDLANPVGATDRQVTANFTGQYGTEADIGSTLFHMGQFASSDLATMALPVLKNAYVALFDYKHTDGGSDVDHADNWGVYKIIDTPVLMPVDASDLESGQGSRNTLHGYGSDYSAHTRSSLNTIVANIMVRVESDEVRSIYPDSSQANQSGKALTPTGLLHDTTYYTNNVLKKPTAKLGHSWRILKRSTGNYFQDVFIFDVVDQGGSPTGAPADLNGLEINPRALGKDSFPAEIVPLAYSDYGNSDTPSEIEFAPDFVVSPAEPHQATLGVRLLGVHRNMNHRGRTTSIAFITSSVASWVASYGPNVQQMTSTGNVNVYGSSYSDTSLRSRIGDFIGDSPARLVVYASERTDRLDEAITSKTKRNFENGESGYVSLGYAERFGLGVVLDGGLGVVSGNAVRVHPQKGNFDSLGSLSLYSSPMMDSRLDLRDGNAVTLPSRFNRTEFYGDVVIAGHDSDLVIDDARTVDGAVARMFEAQVSAGTTKNYQSRLMRFRESFSPFGENYFTSSAYFQEARGIFEEGSLPNTFGSQDYLSEAHFLNVPPPPLPNDTILPWTNAGIRVKTGGSVVYERPFRPQDATGADIAASMAKGAKSDRGLRGLEIPAYGECLLLPKGPPTLGGRVFENSAGAKVRTGLTATDLPLYEFYNGPQAFGYGGDFSITIGNVFQEHGLYGRDGISEGGVLNSISENKGSFEASSDGSGITSEFNPGVISQAYKHSRSNQGLWGKGKRNLKLFVSFNQYSSLSNENFALFYFYGGVRQYITLNLSVNSVAYTINSSTIVRTLNGYGALETVVDSYGTNKPFYKAHQNYNSVEYNRDWTASELNGSTGLDITAFTGFTWDASLNIPSEVSNIYVETEDATTLSGVHPDIAVYFSEFSTHHKSTTTAESAGASFDASVYPYLDLFPNSGASQIAIVGDNKFVHRIAHTNSPHSYGYNNNIGYTELEADPRQSAQAVDKRTDATDWFDTSSSTTYPSLISNGDVDLVQDDNLIATNVSNQFSVGYGAGSSQSEIPLQVRLVDGMVLEDVTTGTFYTVGEIGRYRGWQAHMKPLGQPGDFTQMNHPNVSDTSDLVVNTGAPFTVGARRTMNTGSMVAINGWSTPEIMYDLAPHFDFEKNPSESSTANHLKNGFGDRVDGGHVRRPLLGHKFRVVPNVEFVPVLGHRSVKGGLSVPYDKATNYASYIAEADAILYDAQYHFTDSDIGRKIYICGTYEYAYVGWYAIIGTQKDYVVNPYTNNTITEELFDVAVVRKIKRSGEYERTWKGENGLALPMRPRKPILEASLDKQTNGREIYYDGLTDSSNLDFHIFDPFTPYGTEHSYVLDDYVTGFDVGNSTQTGNDPTTGIWLGLQVNVKSTLSTPTDFLFYGVGASKAKLLGESQKGTYFLVQALNSDANFNGVRHGYTFKTENQSDPTSFVGWGNYDGATPWIKWEIKYAYQDKSVGYPVPFDERGKVPVGEGYLICGITCSIQTHLLTESQKKAVVGRGCFLQAELLFNPQHDTPYGGADFNSLNALNDVNTLHVGRGFYYQAGHSTNVDITWADKNSYFPNMHIGGCADISPASGIQENFNLWTTTTPETTVLSSTEVQVNTNFTRTSQSASGGLRWVFSAPLLEENVGSYVHLTKPRPYRFGQPTYTQLQRQSSLNVLTNPYGWASGWQRKNDLDSSLGNEQIDLSTDIFRINRCASTGDILLGGDCESYGVEDIICRVKGGYSQRGIEIAYSPLSISGNWPDSVTNELPNTGALNYPVLYALQPVARERIVTINPTSATSSILMAHGQYGNAPMVLPASPLAIDTPNSLKGGVNFSDTSVAGSVVYLSFDDAHRIDLVSPAKDAGLVFNGPDGLESFMQSLQLNSIQIDSDYGGKDFVWGERLMMDVSRPWLLMGRESASQTHRFRDINPFSPSDTTNFNNNKANQRTGNERYNINADFVQVDRESHDINVQDMDGGDTTTPLNREIRKTKPNSADWGSLNDGHLEGGEHHQIDDHPALEGGNSETYSIGTEKYARHKQSSGVRQAIYTWTPAGEWWQVQTPVYHGFKSAFVNESTPPPTLKIDLTEAFTQSVSQGSGLNSPYIGRTPRGSRLNRIWVNFGVDGDMSDIPGSPFSEDANEFSHQGDESNTISDLETGGIRSSRWGMGAESNVPYNQLRKSNSSITFNLVVELPGSVARHEDHFYMSDSEVFAEDLFGGDDLYEFMSLKQHSASGGSNGSFMGGRLPTGTYNHSSNSDRASRSSLLGSPVTALSGGLKKFMGGTIVVPLYINREAGDLMPNVMERFVTVGPTRSRTVSTDAKSDWLIGDGKYGLGSLGSTSSMIRGFGQQTEGPYLSHLNVNSHTPVVWGGQNFYFNNTIAVNSIMGLGEDYKRYGFEFESNLDQAGEIQTFDDVRSGNVLASTMPRSSRVGGGVTSSFTSGLYSDLSLFTPEFTNMEMAIHAPATTGITIAHASGDGSVTYTRTRYPTLNSQVAPLNNGGADTSNPLGPYTSLITQSEIEAGAFGHPKDTYLDNVTGNPTRQQAKTSSQCFTLALTPVGDAFSSPPDSILMPKISSSNNVEAKDLYTSTGINPNVYWDLGRYGRTLQTSTGTDPKDRRFKVGNWLDNILEYYGIPAQSGSMLPTGARVFLEVTVPWARRPQKSDLGELTHQSSNNGAWVSSVKCAFEVETADGTAWTQDVNTMGED